MSGLLCDVDFFLCLFNSFWSLISASFFNRLFSRRRLVSAIISSWDFAALFENACNSEKNQQITRGFMKFQGKTLSLKHYEVWFFFTMHMALLYSEVDSQTVWAKGVCLAFSKNSLSQLFRTNFTLNSNCIFLCVIAVSKNPLCVGWPCNTEYVSKKIFYYNFFQTKPNTKFYEVLVQKLKNKFYLILSFFQISSNQMGIIFTWVAFLAVDTGFVYNKSTVLRWPSLFNLLFTFMNIFFGWWGILKLRINQQIKR